MKQLLLISFVLLVACERNEFTVPAPAFLSGGGGYSAPSRPAQTPMAPPTTHQHPMMQDPENEFDENITVYADSPIQAQRKCENVARARSQGAIVQCLGCRRMTKTTG